MYPQTMAEARKTNLTLALIHGLSTIFAFILTYALFFIMIFFIARIDLEFRAPLGFAASDGALWLAERIDGPGEATIFQMIRQKQKHWHYVLSRYDGGRWEEVQRYEKRIAGLHAVGDDLAIVMRPDPSSKAGASRISTWIMRVVDSKPMENKFYPFLNTDETLVAITGEKAGVRILTLDDEGAYALKRYGLEMEYEGEKELAAPDDFIMTPDPATRDVALLGDQTYLFWQDEESAVKFAAIDGGTVGEAEEVAASSDNFYVISGPDRICLLVLGAMRRRPALSLKEFDGKNWTEGPSITVSPLVNRIGLFGARDQGQLHIVYPNGIKSSWKTFDGKTWTSRTPDTPGGTVLKSLLISTLPFDIIFFLPLAVIIPAHFQFKKKKWTHLPIGKDDVEIASLGRRSIAHVIDLLICWIPFYLLFNYYTYDKLDIFVLLPEEPEKYFDAFFRIALLSLLFYVIPPVYFIFFESRYGRTPGKRLMKIRVIREDGGKIGFKEALVRNLLRLVDLFLYYLPVIVMVAATVKQQRLGDLAAKTIVIKDQGEVDAGPAAREEGMAPRAENWPGPLEGPGDIGGMTGGLGALKEG